ncbi:peroxiredoxin [Striga asiatica]|uniref:glutaredoxin-dependent peroxiredoxin n=1 Tax=Striga asiatica TaxID=4170 RepID=A0A5A7P1C9_STRAF|nr:peroxiredoxin [Striga asiatica]
MKYSPPQTFINEDSIDLRSNLGKKVIILAVLDMFTPTCLQKHLLGFVEKAVEFKAKRNDDIVCVSVNNAFVMKAWKANLKIGDEFDLSDKPAGLEFRSKRYTMYVEDVVLKVLNAL